MSPAGLQITLVLPTREQSNAWRLIEVGGVENNTAGGLRGFFTFGSGASRALSGRPYLGPEFTK